MAEWDVPGYTELKALGSGGFGDVVLARHNASGTLVAIKYLHGDLLADQEFAEMFRGEATVLAYLDDPNIVRLYEYVESPSGAAIVMELIDGVTLREILTHQGRTTAEAALVVLQGSLLGLAAAHRHGVVHRDYKPENVLVDGGGASKLTDFGIAARAGDCPVPAGTVLYAAPEQMAGASASPAGDVYAATATFYECLTGRPPFTGESTGRCSTSITPRRCPWSRCPHRCGRWWPPGWPRTPDSGRLTLTPLSSPSMRLHQSLTARTGRIAAGRIWARRRCCWRRCGRPADRPRSKALPWSGSP